jgi:hypothetical protein
MALRASLDAVAKRGNSFPCRKSGPNSLSRSLVTVLTELLLRNQYVSPLSLFQTPIVERKNNQNVAPSNTFTQADQLRLNIIRVW